MSAAKPMNLLRRLDNYVEQNGAPGLTAVQQRRFDKKNRHRPSIGFFERELEPAAARIATPYELAILHGLNTSGRHVYAGTVPAAVKAARRIAGRRTRTARKGNR